MLEKLEKAEKIYNRIKTGNYSIEYYYHLKADLEGLLSDLKEGFYND